MYDQKNGANQTTGALSQMNTHSGTTSGKAQGLKPE